MELDLRRNREAAQDCPTLRPSIAYQPYKAEVGKEEEKKVSEEHPVADLRVLWE